MFILPIRFHLVRNIIMFYFLLMFESVRVATDALILDKCAIALQLDDLNVDINLADQCK